MISRYEQSGVTWIDFQNPSVEEVQPIAQEFDLSQELVDDLLSPTNKPRSEVYHNCVYLVLHFPSLRYTRGAENDQEIDIILGKDFLITTHYATTSATFDLSKAFEAAALLPGKNGKKSSSGFILLELMGRLYKGTEHELDSLEDTIEDIEKKIFTGREREMVTTISIASRELLTHQRIMNAHHTILKRFKDVVTTLFGEEMGRYVRAVNALHYRVHSRVFSMNSILDELRETNMALLSTRQNEIMKNLTIMAFVTFPLTLLAAIFGMNTVHTPIVGLQHDFYWILGGMATLTVAFFVYFKGRRWF